MHSADIDNEPKIDVSHADNQVHIALQGDWISSLGKRADDYAARLVEIQENQPVIFDLSGLGRLDTVGSWLIIRSARTLESRGIKVQIQGQSATHDILLTEISSHTVEEKQEEKQSGLVTFLSEIGKSVIQTRQDAYDGIVFFGQVVSALIRVLFRPKSFRFTSLVTQMEQVALRGVPIIVLISFLVGCIIAQQGIFQLKTFGATVFVVDLISILTLRELAVLLTAIMIAGRSGSAYTAELGSMKMSEEVDALRVMGLDPIEVLIVPRILALIIGLPLLTFIASMSGLLGGAITAALYGDIPSDVFLTRLQSAIAMNTFFAGIIKAPFMALVIGVIACSEGLAVKGSAESLGRNVTSAVVKSIFMVILMDGIFAMFYAAINF